MQIEIRVVGDEAGDDVRSLVRWLDEDDDLRSATLRQVEAAVQPDEMGPVIEALQLAGDPRVVAAVIGAVTAWLTTRSRVVKVRLKKGDKEVEVEGSSDDDPQELASDLMDRLDQ